MGVWCQAGERYTRLHVQYSTGNYRSRATSSSQLSAAKKRQKRFCFFDEKWQLCINSVVVTEKQCIDQLPMIAFIDYTMIVGVVKCPDIRFQKTWQLIYIRAS